jgi:glucokinase
VRASFRRHLTGRGHRPEARIARAALGTDAGVIGAADLARAESVSSTHGFAAGSTGKASR